MFKYISSLRRKIITKTGTEWSHLSKLAIYMK
jgi:hypothetical protein